MKKLVKRRIVFIVLSVVILIASILPVIISKDASITKYSFISLAFALGSIVYAIIAFIFKDQGNLFIAGKYWLCETIDWSFSEDVSYAESEDNKKEFELHAFIYCVTIPIYILFAFFANGCYSELLKAVLWTFLRELAIIVVMVIPIIKRIKAKKQQLLKDEADRKEQERNESMGKWK